MKSIVVIGGGAAGFFGAVTCAEANPSAKVILLEKNNALLSKVRVSGGGRCNVTHACFNPKELVENYPRGHKELLAPFYRFQPKDTIAWFEKRGVPLKTEADGRMFPITDSSETIIECLRQEAAKTGVEIRCLQKIEKIEKHDQHFEIFFVNGEKLACSSLLLATGSNKEGHQLAESLGHSLIESVPSLFTFNIPNSPLKDLAGISVNPAVVHLEGVKLQQQGPLLITHWGFSGPAVLKLSAWEARRLHGLDYQANLLINWIPEYTQNDLFSHFLKIKDENPHQNISNTNFPSIPKQLWKSLLIRSDIDPQKKMRELSNKMLHQLAKMLQNDSYKINGKTTYKQEFVTCGGIPLNEVNFKTMESRKTPGLYFAGEILDIDAVTGGFNFQNAWTTGWIAGNSMS